MLLQANVAPICLATKEAKVMLQPSQGRSRQEVLPSPLPELDSLEARLLFAEEMNEQPCENDL